MLGQRYEVPTVGIPTFAIDKSQSTNVTELRNPEYDLNIAEWSRWRQVYDAGQRFVNDYLRRFSRRERGADFEARRAIATCPAFATAAINDVKNSIFQRMPDISRDGGTATYTAAIRGDNGGIDRRGSTMNWFVGNQILPELLVMKRVGVFVDMPATITNDARPWLYRFNSEDILNWSYNEEGLFDMVLLRSRIDVLHPVYRLPIRVENQYRLLFMLDGRVGVIIFDAQGKKVREITLALPVIPFVMFKISHSLMQNVAGHQIALLNLESSDLSFLLRANIPMYTEQVKGIETAGHLATRDKKEGDPNAIEVGAVHGRTYGPSLDRPGFIAPPTEPLKASMDKQKNLKDDIRNLVNLAVANIQSSAESKQMDQTGLEAGLSNIGVELEHGERQLALIWAAYEGSEDVPQIKYPDRYSMKTDSERQGEAEKALDLKKRIPSTTYQKHVLKKTISTLIGDRIPTSNLKTMLDEIDRAKVLDADPEVLQIATEAGWLTSETASEAQGYPVDEVSKATAERIERLKQTAIAQGGIDGNNPAARGLAEADPNPNSGSDEKIGKPKRGEGA